MSRKGQDGQLIPQQVTEARLCYQLEIPDTREWRIALRTLVLLFTRGRYWKRAIAGRTIKETQTTGWEIYDSLRLCDIQPNGNGEPQPPEVIIIKEVKMSKCNCCDCPKTPVEQAPEETLIPPALIPPEPIPDVDIPVDGSFLDWKCQSARYLTDVGFRNLLLGLTDFVEITDDVYEQVDEFLVGTLGAVIGGTVFTVLWGTTQVIVYWLIRILTPTITARLVAFLDNNRDGFVQDIFCADSPNSAILNWHARVINTTELNFINKSIFNFLIRAIPFSGHFQNAMERMAAPAFEQITNDFATDCTCPAPIGDINLPSGYVKVPMFLDTFTALNGAIVSTMSNEIQWVGQGNSGFDGDMFNPILNASTVPNIARSGFSFELIFRDDQGTGAGVGHNVSVAGIQIGSINFGGAELDWNVNEFYNGAIPADVTLTTWLTTETFKHKDFGAKTDLGNVRIRFIQDQGGTNLTGDFSTAVIRCFWIVDTALIP